jgi:hypothetical protein
VAGLRAGLRREGLRAWDGVAAGGVACCEAAARRPHRVAAAHLRMFSRLTLGWKMSPPCGVRAMASLRRGERGGQRGVLARRVAVPCQPTAHAAALNARAQRLTARLTRGASRAWFQVQGATS